MNNDKTISHSVKVTFFAATSETFTWKSRYSPTDKSDKHGRWARLCYHNNQLIALVNRIEHIQHGTYFVVNDFFPSLQNDNPLYTGKESSFEAAKTGIETRFINFAKSINIR